MSMFISKKKQKETKRNKKTSKIYSYLNVKKGNTKSVLPFLRKTCIKNGYDIYYLTVVTLIACGPFSPSVTSNSTFCPSSRVLKPSMLSPE